MFNKQLQALSAAQDMGEMARALANPTQHLEHMGRITITTNLPSEDRSFASYNTASKCRPSPPVDAPIIDGATLVLENAANALSDRHGDNGYALHVKSGISRFDGPAWILRWATVDSRGETGDYFYTDGYECSNGYGGDVTTVPVRLFYQSAEARSAVGDVVGFVYDNNGIAYGLAVDYSTSGGDSGYERCTAIVKGAFASSASTATVDNVDPISGDDPTAAAGTELTVYNTHDWAAGDNAECRIEYNNETEHWEFYSLERYERCTAIAKGVFIDTDVTATVDNVSAIIGSSPTSGSAVELTVYNTHDWDGDDNAACRIEYNNGNQHWEFYQVDCPA